MKQDLKNYFRRTMYVHGSFVVAQILMLCFVHHNILSSIMSIVILEPFVMGGYLIIFGVKRKDGTLIRLKKIDKFMTEYEETEKRRKETVELLQSFIDKHERKKK